MSSIQRALAALKSTRILLQEELDGLRAGTQFSSELRDGRFVDTTAETTEAREVWLAYTRAIINSFEEHSG